MDPLYLGFVMIAVMLTASMLGLPVGFSLILSGTIGYMCLEGLDPAVTQISLVLWDTGTNFLLIAVPLFILMGQLIFHTGMAGQLFTLMQRLTQRLPGGLGVSTVLASAAFGAVTGSSVAAVATMGNIAVPEMMKRGYSTKLATSTVASAATLAILIPPSIPLVIYGVWTETSIGRLFVAGIIPGLILAVLFALTVMLQPKQYRTQTVAVTDQGVSLKQLTHELVGASGLFLVFLLVVGGIYLGWFSPTEASGVGCASILIIAVLLRRFSLRALASALQETLRTSSAVFVVLYGGIVFSRFLVQTELPEFLVNWIGALPLSGLVIMLLLVVLYLILGAVMDTFGMLILTLPVVLPITQKLGYDPVWTGVFLTILMEIAMITPPIGLNVFVLERATGIPSKQIFAGVWPFVLITLLFVVLLILFPQIALWLPQSMTQ